MLQIETKKSSPNVCGNLVQHDSDGYCDSRSMLGKKVKKFPTLPGRGIQMPPLVNQVGVVTLLLIVFIAWTTWATTATIYFSSDQYGQNRITNIQEGDRIWIAVYDPDENIDCDFRDKIFPDISLMDPKTGALLDWNNTGNLSGDYLGETSDDSGLFISSRYFRIGARKNVALKNWKHTPGDLVNGADSYSGGVYASLSVTGRIENMDTVYGMYQDPNDDTDIAVTMGKIIDTEATISWNQSIYLDSHGSATITIVDSDENLYSSEMEEVPVCIIVNPGSWNPVQNNSPTNFCMLKRFGGIDPADGSVVNQPIRWHNIYDSGLGGPYPSNSQPVYAGAYYIQYPVSGNVATFDTTDANGYCRAMFYAKETGFDTGVFQLRLDNILSTLGFDSLNKRDTLVAYYIDPNDFDDFKLAVAYIEEHEHSVTSFADKSRADTSVYWVGRDPVYVQAIDSNANVDCCGDPEQVLVYICDPHGEDDSEWVILDETSSNSPIFFTQARMSLLPVWDALGLGVPGPGGWQLQLDNWNLEVYNEDSIYARYNDVYYTQDAINSLGDSNSNTAFPPEIAAVRVANDVSFDVVEIGDTQVCERSTHNMYFLDRAGNQVTSYTNGDCVLIEVIDPDQNEDVDHRDRIDAFWDGQQETPFGPMDFEDNHAACGHGYNDVQVHPVNPLLGDTNIFGTGYSGNPSNSTSWAKVYVLNPRNGRWAAVDLLETGVNTGHFVSVTSIDLVSVYDYVPTLAVLPNDTVLAYYQDPSNHSDFAVAEIKVIAGGPDYPPALIQNFSASDGEDRKCMLRWNNPSDIDLAEVVVRRRTNKYPTSHNDGDEVKRYTSATSEGLLEYVDTSLTNGTTYYYAVFSCDAAGHWNDQVVEGKNANTGKPCLENLPPETSIVDASISGNTATFTWSGSDDTTPATELTYSYRLVRPGPAYDAWSSWSSGKTKKYTDLFPGNYKFQVRARDAEKVMDPSPASRDFTIGEGALNCAIELRKQDTSNLINGIDINKPFDIYVGGSTGNAEQVRFSSDESQDATPTGEWTDWYDWAVSSGDWDANTRTTAWSFATSGKKEVWAEIKDSNGSSDQCYATIFVHPGYAIVAAGQGGWREKRGLDHSANNAYRALRNLGFDDDHILYLNSILQEIDGRNVVDMPASPDSLQNALDEIRDRVGENSTFLILYLTGHGFQDHFDFDPDGPLTTILDASTLRGMLADFPASRMFIMIGSCYSGSFITIDRGNNDSISAKETIIVTGAHNDETRVLLGWVRSSDCLWGDLIEGSSIKDAFARRTLPGDKRHLWLDDNGDAVGHPPHALGDDGAIAAVTKIGTPGSDDLELKPWIFYWIRSPGKLSVYDTQGRVTGLVNGEVKEEIPDSLYDEANGLVALFSPSGLYYCQVVGTGEGSYGLEVSSIEGGEATTFAATGIPTTSGATHKYIVDWDALARDKDGVTLQVDSDGDGTFEETIHAGPTLDGTTTPVGNQPPQVNILAPVVGEVVNDASYQIQWQATDSDNPASSLSIDLFYSTNGGTTWTSIATNEANDGVYDWNISALRGGEYWLKLVAEDPEGGTSEATVGPFTISVFEGNIIIAPNPVTSTGTAFFYTLPEETSTAKLMIFNVAGRPVFETSLDVDSTRFPDVGTWNPVDQDGVPLANSPYVYVLIADGKVIGQGKMVIQR